MWMTQSQHVNVLQASYGQEAGQEALLFPPMLTQVNINGVF